jgi:chloride channel 7
MTNTSSLNTPLMAWENSRENTPRPRPVRQKVIWDVTDSINYLPPNNNVALTRQASLQDERNSTIFGITGRTFTALCTTIIAGLLIGITARVMEAGIDSAVAWRNNTFLSPLLLVSPVMAIAYYLALASSIVVFTAGVVQWLAPGAAGAGVHLVIAVLNGNNIAGLFTPLVYAVKMFGTVTSRMAGLALGPEAPMVHLGACVASLIFAAERRVWGDAKAETEDKSKYANWKQDLDPAFSNSSHREMISAGTAAGLAAAFGAPIGGVLFALEEACSVWSRKTAWRCLLCAAMAVFTISQLMPSISGGGILSLSGIYPLSSRQWLKQMPFVAAVSAGAGLLGAFYNLMRRNMQRLRAARRRHVLRLLEAGVVAAVTVCASTAASSLVGTCLEIPSTWKADDVLQWTCEQGQYNDLATALLGSSPFVVRSLLGLGSESEPINNNICTLGVPCYYSPLSLATLCVVYLGLMVLSSGLAVPGGLFMPSIIAGGSFGAVCGMLLTAVLPPSWDVQPGVYAMIGAVATMAAVFRSSISLVVIIVEGTRGVEFLPGILAATIISNFIAYWLHPDGIYESELERDGRVFFLRQEPPGVLRWRTAEGIMAAPVLGVKRIEEVSKIVELLTSTTHNGFPVHPVVENGVSGQEENLGSESPSSSRLDGFILRTQLLVLLQERAFCDMNGNYLLPPEDINHFESTLDSLMHATECSCDGLGGAAELALAVDPLGPAENQKESEMGGTAAGVSAAMIPTLETLETLRSLPSLAECLQEDNVAAMLNAGSFSNINRGHGPSAAATAAAAAAVESSGSETVSRVSYDAPPRSAAPTLYLNLTPFMDRGMFSVRPDTPATNLHKMFVALSLRHLCVVSDTGRVVGMITRKDLDNAAGHGPWRSNKRAPSPAREGVVPGSESWLSSTLQALIYRIRTPQTASEVDGESPHPGRSPALLSMPLSATVFEEDVSVDQQSELDSVDTEIGGSTRNPLPGRQYSML